MLWYQYQKSGDVAMNLIESNAKIQKTDFAVTFIRLQDIL